MECYVLQWVEILESELKGLADETDLVFLQIIVVGDFEVGFVHFEWELKVLVNLDNTSRVFYFFLENLIPIVHCLVTIPHFFHIARLEFSFNLFNTLL